jgi:phosphotriesterase-related protein
MGQAMVETVRGPVPAHELGVTLAHEHLHVLTDGVQTAFPRVYDRAAIVQAGVQRVRDAEALGARSMIDLTVIGLGRDIGLTREVAAQVDLHIVVATGAYYFDQLPGYFRGRPVEHLAEQFVLDIVDGIAGTPTKAAVLKCPTDAPGLTADNEKLLRAVAIAHRETGTPISTHTHAALQRGRDQVRVFREEGVDLTRTVIGHCGDTDDFDYLFEIADTGAFLGMDRFGYDANLPLGRRVEVIAELCTRGHADQIVVSHDYCCHIDWFPHPIDHPSMTYLFTQVVPALRAGGLDDATIDRFLVDNPRRFLAGA